MSPSLFTIAVEAMDEPDSRWAISLLTTTKTREGSYSNGASYPEPEDSTKGPIWPAISYLLLHHYPISCMCLRYVIGAYRFETVGFDRGKARAIIETSKKQNNISNNLHLGECFRSRYASCYGLLIH